MQYNLENDTITIKARYVDVIFQFSNGEVIEVMFNGWNIPATDDTLHGLIVDLKTGLEYEFITAHALMLEVVGQYEVLRNEAEQEDLDNAYMQRELSSLYYTGRV